VNHGIGKPRRAVVAAVVGAAALACGIPGLAVAAEGSMDTGSSGGIFSGSADAAGSGTRDGSPNGADGAPRVVRCGQQSKSGGQAVTNTKHLMGRPGPLTFTLNYNTGTQADKIDVFYQGKFVGGSGNVKGAGSKKISVKAGTNDYVTVKVTGPVGGYWSYTLTCPA
jgi:hypothetical protein